MLKHFGCMVHAFKQQLFSIMVMVRPKKESISDGVSRKLSTGEENKHKKINILTSGCKYCVKL
jgi:hypothetical protein